ncbi:unnamed protein product [Thlaspi arvense]|uniref:RING-type E3 ubiquitin transferase n=1 Tax=Thlaspi arvense TaxID=13288 RepID=A0AAU9RPZ7_THLAR|nr:unnamed protein product [Thlaspi arvense]
MALEIQLSCDSDGACMRCKVTIPSEECLTCSTCVTPWHVSCLRSPPKTLASTQAWECPDCSGVVDPVSVSEADGFKPDGSSLVAAIRAIEADESLTEAQKAKKRQRLLSGKGDEEDEEKDTTDVLAALKESFQCIICLQLLEKPVTTPCGHNFCLKCFQKWAAKGDRKCGTCRAKVPIKMVQNPRINLTLVAALRLAKDSESASVATTKVQHYISNQERPATAFTTERAVLAGKANACCGKRWVTSPSDHFGPIGPEYDPTRNRGVLVGDIWEDRYDCKQWGAHNSHMAGISGQSSYGAQSVALSGGYEDDQDHGEWFLYTGSGGRDLSGNKRTNKEQSFDQTFTNGNEALSISCIMGYPVRVIRTHKDVRSAYAPIGGKTVRYDGVYRIEKCWKNVGVQGFKVCRYLFVRCDNEAAPWTSNEHGDRPRPLPNISELSNAIELIEREESPSWDFDVADGTWKWVKPPPASRQLANMNKGQKRGRKSSRDKLLEELSCLICRDMMKNPVTTPCAHNFCKDCLTAKFAGISQVNVRSRGGRTLRAIKNVMKCPCCNNDIADFLQDPQVNRKLKSLIENLEKKEKDYEETSSGGGNTEEKEDEDVDDEGEGEEEGKKEEEEPKIVAEDEPPTKKIKLV